MNSNMDARVECPHCKTPNSPLAFLCSKCGKIFDGSAGNTIPDSHRAGNSVRAGLPGTSPIMLSPPREINDESRPAGSRLSPCQFPPAILKRDIRAAVITFSDDARPRIPPSPVSQVGPFVLSPNGCTNEVAGLRLARETWEKNFSYARLSVILLGDGKPNKGAGWFGDHCDAAIKEAAELKNRHAQISTIAVHGASMDLDHLRQLASSPALALEAQVGKLTHTFLHASRKLTGPVAGQGLVELLIYVIDESGSMNEGNKKAETEDAVNSSIQYLQTL